ncbi:spore cortex-lytic enzyme [Gracilibacillus alcaliphilus]|uniref:spore cortex-lytic enzyme n=1 Tax=Gracilibacillus alcaliphilus TaxID=1401441 RepID=UPI00195B6B57|nr:spore cortex-lytic enzyme [Gracilibacillus alcaliphilus]MBM7675167.1 N-acetylmuramoyl-L-alanine amidase [Gracilibacillus alcaliphilus]
MKNKVILGSLLFLFFAYITADLTEREVSGFSDQVIQHGATGDDVIELQARLQHLGFYNGKIDGVFGWGTYWALRNFQYEFGMEIDGLAGQTTKQKLEQASEFDKAYVHEQIQKGANFTHYGEGDNSGQSNNQETEDLEPTAVNVPQGFSQNDIQIMANAVYGEARGEPYEGQVAVAAVILNRVESASFPNTVSGVIFEPRAFTAVADGQIWLTPNESAKRAVLDAINGWDPTGDALYYFNPDTATSGWIWTRPQIKRIGKHIFCM